MESVAGDGAEVNPTTVSPEEMAAIDREIGPSLDWAEWEALDRIEREAAAWERLESEVRRAEADYLREVP